MPDEARLRERARAALQNGKIPTGRASETWGGPGVGNECAICQRSITKAEMELELQFERDASDPGLGKYHVHPRCFAAFELERTKAPQS